MRRLVLVATTTAALAVCGGVATAYAAPASPVAPAGCAQAVKTPAGMCNNKMMAHQSMTKPQNEGMGKPQNQGMTKPQNQGMGKTQNGAEATPAR